MSLDDYHSAWSAAGTAPQKEVTSLIDNLQRSERRRRRLLMMFSLNTTAALVFTVVLMATRPDLSWSESLPVIGLQLFLVVSLGVLIRNWQKRQRLLQSAVQSVLDSTRSALRSVSNEIREVRLMLVFAAIVIPALAYIVNGLIADGKMNTQQALGFAAVCSVILAVNAALQWFRYSQKLVPRRDRLQQILTSLSD